uniref:Uncharacterized protein n=1 Tax=Helianthus annuus TaxID=4232 RepID=A0A251S0Y0_HELAN
MIFFSKFLTGYQSINRLRHLISSPAVLHFRPSGPFFTQHFSRNTLHKLVKNVFQLPYHNLLHFVNFFIKVIINFWTPFSFIV